MGSTHCFLHPLVYPLSNLEQIYAFLYLVIGGIIGGRSAGVGPIAGLIGGVSTGLVLRRTVSAIQRNQVIAITLGWFVGFSIAFAGIRAGNGLVGLIGMVIGGLVTGLVLRRVNAFTQRKQTVIITIGWVISFLIAALIAVPISRIFGEILAFPIVGAVYGAIGAWVMLRQLK